MKVLVTGGSGFIGSAVVRYLVGAGHEVVNLDSLTYAGDVRTVESVADDPRYTFVKADIRDAVAVAETFRIHHPDAVLHLAAESHVDRSIDGPAVFIETNVVGTGVLLDMALNHWRSLSEDSGSRFRLVHVSTDEVFGELGSTGQFSETTPYNPSSPYSASKAAADHLVRAWGRTYGLPIIVTNCSNNYGPYQHPEKLIPTVIRMALSGLAIPVYGKGENVRDWLYVEDHVRALARVLERGVPGETYCIGGNNEQRNIDVVREICGLLDSLSPRADGESFQSQITFVKDRPGHDFRYAIDASKMDADLGWRPSESFTSGLQKTVAWHLDNQPWWQDAGKQSGRLGLDGDGDG